MKENSVNIRLKFSSKKLQYREFIQFKKEEAGGYVNDEDVKEEQYDNYSIFEISLPANLIYSLGYDWALWQFPPK